MARQRTANPNRKERKLAQLCAQVEQAVALALAAAEDTRLHRLVVHSVIPGPDAARLLARVVVSDGDDLDSVEDSYRALESARTWLRQQVADEIHRKRAPELSFVVLPCWEQDL